MTHRRGYRFALHGGVFDVILQLKLVYVPIDIRDIEHLAHFVNRLKPVRDIMLGVVISFGVYAIPSRDFHTHEPTLADLRFQRVPYFFQIRPELLCRYRDELVLRQINMPVIIGVMT